MSEPLNFTFERSTLTIQHDVHGDWITSDFRHFQEVDSAARAQCRLHLANLDQNFDEYNDQIEKAAADAKFHAEKMMAAQCGN